MFLVTLFSAMAAFSQAADTTFPVREGMRLELRNHEGEVRVSTWGRSEVRLVTARSGGASFTIERDGAVVRVREKRRRHDYVDVALTVPTFLALSIRGNETDVTVIGTEAEVAVRTTDGDIEISGGRGYVAAKSVDGDVRVSGAVARVDVGAGDGDVVLDGIVGDVTIKAIDGNVDLLDVDARTIEVTNVDGDIEFRGRVHDNGRYDLSTHDGNVTLYLSPDVNAEVSVAVQEGGFETSFPVLLREARRRLFEFTLGTGSARISVGSFDGDVFLHRKP